MRPTRWQYIFATNWLPALLQWTWSLNFVVCALLKIKPTAEIWGDPWFVLLAVFVIGIAFLLGWFACIIPAWFLFGPLLYSQGHSNGGPFVPGDRVYIIAGKHRGRFSRVYATCEADILWLDLGDREQAGGTNIFGAYQVLRAGDAEQRADVESFQW